MLISRLRLIALGSTLLAQATFSAETNSSFETLKYRSAGGVAVERLENELPDYTIEREYQKHAPRYSYIQPADPERATTARVFKSISYSKDQADLTLDLVLPAQGENFPIVLMIHGGGWRSGDKSHFLDIAKILAENGIACATVSYRTSKTALYPAGMIDIENALAFLINNAQTYSLDVSRLGLMGGSSGAHMASLLGLRLNQANPDLVDVVVNFDGVVETESEGVRYYEDRPGKLSYLALWLGGRTVDEPDLWREVSPLNYVDKNAPAFVFMNSAQPRFHFGRDELVEKLNSFGIPSLIHEIPDTPHTFWLFRPWLDEALDHLIPFLKGIFDNRVSSTPSINPDYLGDARIQALPAGERDAWINYKQTSTYYASLDSVARDSEAEDWQLPTSSKVRSVAYDEINTLTANQRNSLLSFQTPSGGWSKGTDFLTHTRTPDTAFGREFDYIPTFDNGATTSELRLLANTNHSYEPDVTQAIVKGLTLILDAQMPNGGWPQSFPLRGGYHDLCTHNDNATANILELLIDALRLPNLYGVDTELQTRIVVAIDRSLAHISNEQVWTSATEGAWGQQHDPIDHRLVSARSFEPAALATMETANLLRVLMQVPEPPDSIIKAIHGGVAWLKKHRIDELRWQRYDNQPSELIYDEKAPPLWPRFIDPDTEQPIFGDRNARIYHDVRQISLERQRHYAWYHASPSTALKEYARWLDSHS